MVCAQCFLYYILCLFVYSIPNVICLYCFSDLSFINFNLYVFNSVIFCKCIIPKQVNRKKKILVIHEKQNFLLSLNQVLWTCLVWYQFRSHTDFWEICKSHDNGHIKLVFQLISGEPGFILFPFQTPLKPSQSVLQAHELDFFCPSQTDKTHPTLAALML